MSYKECKELLMKIIESSNVSEEAKRCLRNMIDMYEKGFNVTDLLHFQEMHYGFDSHIINILAEGERELCILEDNLKNSAISKLQYFEERVRILGIIKLHLDIEVFENYLKKEMKKHE